MQTETDTSATSTSDPIPAKKGLLINRNFAMLAIGQAISNMGDFVYNTTLLIWVFTLTHSAAAVSGVLAAEYIPVFLFGPMAGVFVDRWNRRHTMLIADLIRAFAAILPLLAPSAVRLQAIYISVFLIMTMGQFFAPAKSGVLQVIVEQSEQAKAASVSQSSFALSFILGPAIASPLYFAVGPVIAILINAISYLISALFLLLLRAPKTVLHPHAFKQGDSTEHGIRGIAHETIAGLKFVVTTHTLLIIMLMAIIAMLGGGALNALDIVFASRNLHMNTSFYGILTAVSGVGMLVGVIVAGALSQRLSSSRLLTSCLLLMGTGFVIYSFQNWYIAGLIICFFMCIPQGALNIALGPLLLNATPRDMIGRVQAVTNTTIAGASLVSVAIAGELGQFLPVGIILTGCGIMLFLSGAFGWFTLKEPVPSTIADNQAPELKG